MIPEPKTEAEAVEAARQLVKQIAGKDADMSQVEQKFDRLVAVVQESGYSMRACLAAMQQFEMQIVRGTTAQTSPTGILFEATVQAIKDRHAEDIAQARDSTTPSRGPRERRRFPIRR